MKVIIILDDEEGNEAISISNCHKDDLVHIELMKSSRGVNVSIEELKSALRKITTK